MRAYRTPVGRFGGQFRSVSAPELAAQLVPGLFERTGVRGEQIDDVIFAQCYPTMDAPALGRVIALDAGLPIGVAGLQIDRRCGSGLQAVIYAAMQVATGASEIVLAGGAESMSSAPFYSSKDRWGVEGTSIEFHDALARGRVTAGGIKFPVPGGMLETAENLRREYRIGRVEQDDFAVASRRKAVAAQENGTFDDEIVPVTIKSRKGEQVIRRDEHPRADASVESLSKLRPILGRTDPRRRSRREMPADKTTVPPQPSSRRRKLPKGWDSNPTRKWCRGQWRASHRLVWALVRARLREGSDASRTDALRLHE